MSVPFDGYQSFIYKSRYARWDDTQSRRENWPETIDRYLTFMSNHVNSLESKTKGAWNNFEEYRRRVLCRT